MQWKLIFSIVSIAIVLTLAMYVHKAIPHPTLTFAITYPCVVAMEMILEENNPFLQN